MAFPFRATASLALIASLFGPPGHQAGTAQAANPDPHSISAGVDPDTTVFPRQPDIQRWRSQHADLCLQASEIADQPGEQYQSSLRDFLVQSPLMARLYDDLDGTGITICKGEQTQAWNSEFSYRPREKMVVLPFKGTTGFFAVQAIEKIRLGWQDSRGGYDNDLFAMSKQALLADVFLRRAEAAAFTIGAAYELKQAGQPDAWNYLSADLRTRPMVERFEQVMTTLDEVVPPFPADKSMVQVAMREAYYRWFDTSEFTRTHEESFGEVLAQRPNSQQPPHRLAQRLAATQPGLLQATGTDADRPGIFLGEKEIRRAVEAALEVAPSPRPTASFRRP
ncbi:MAG: DUF6782 family putative metallopeptidase [Pseudomonadota bacterium]